MSGTICGAEYWEELTTEEWDSHVLLVRKIFKVVISEVKNTYGHTAKHRKKALVAVIREIASKPGGDNKLSAFYSKSAEAYARLKFLMTHEKAMAENLQALKDKESRGELISKDEKRFHKSLSFDEPIGFGVWRIAKDSACEYHSQIRTVTFLYKYQNGSWYEETVYPDMELHNRRFSKEPTYRGRFDIADFYEKE